MIESISYHFNTSKNLHINKHLLYNNLLNNAPTIARSNQSNTSTHQENTHIYTQNKHHNNIILIWTNMLRHMLFDNKKNVLTAYLISSFT